MLAPPPLHDTLFPSEPPRGPSQPKEGSSLSPTRDKLQPSGLTIPPVNSTLPNSALEGPSNEASELQADMPPLDETALHGTATDMHSAGHASEIGQQTGGKTASAPLYDTLDPGMTLGQAGSKQEADGDDEMLIRQVVSDESAGAVHARPAPGQDDDDEALLRSLLEEEEAVPSASC